MILSTGGVAHSYIVPKHAVSRVASGQQNWVWHLRSAPSRLHTNLNVFTRWLALNKEGNRSYYEEEAKFAHPLGLPCVISKAVDRSTVERAASISYIPMAAATWSWSKSCKEPLSRFQAERLVGHDFRLGSLQARPPTWSCDQGELAVSYRWTGRVWEMTGWSSRLQENYRSF